MNPGCRMQGKRPTHCAITTPPPPVGSIALALRVISGACHHISLIHPVSLQYKFCLKSSMKIDQTHFTFPTYISFTYCAMFEAVFLDSFRQSWE